MGTNAKGAFRALAQNTSKQKLWSWGEVMSLQCFTSVWATWLDLAQNSQGL